MFEILKTICFEKRSKKKSPICISSMVWPACVKPGQLKKQTKFFEVLFHCWWFCFANRKKMHEAKQQKRWAQFEVLAGFDAIIVHDPCLWPMGCSGRNDSRDCRDCGCDCD
ncbi:unnamed protein product [Symbiodinium natans]|uniref:Uncharacterized protein n=1 Tax=Symbiodinium natans TaxID=878477 RepID=A0A812PJR0_9DINO|nr:unnamed protein product [Symbiodinium natans]